MHLIRYNGDSSEYSGSGSLNLNLSNAWVSIGFLSRNSLKDKMLMYSLRLAYWLNYSYLVSTVRQKTRSAWDEIIGFQKVRHLHCRL
jgi:hypothetical protein